MSGESAALIGGEAEQDPRRRPRGGCEAANILVRLQIHFLLLLFLRHVEALLGLFGRGGGGGHGERQLKELLMLLLQLLLTLDAGVLALTFEMLFPPFDAPVLEPDFDLSFAEVERGGEVIPLRADHVLLSLELLLQPLQLLRGEDGSDSLRLYAQAVAAAAAVVAAAAACCSAKRGMLLLLMLLLLLLLSRNGRRDGAVGVAGVLPGALAFERIRLGI